MPKGDYRIEIYAGKEYPLISSADTVVGPIKTGDIKIRGQIYNSLTNKGIPDASFIVLNPGVDLDEWLNNPTESDIYTAATTDSKGNFVLPDPLERLVDYPVVVAAEGYYPILDFWRFGQTDPGQVTFNVPLQPR